jgi:hypothetical protein
LFHAASFAIISRARAGEVRAGAFATWGADSGYRASRRANHRRTALTGAEIDIDRRSLMGGTTETYDARFKKIGSPRLLA